MIFIPYNTPSLKNGKIKTRSGIFSSPTVTKYLRKLGIQAFSSSKKTVKGYKDPSRPNQFEALKEEFREMCEGKGYPLIIGYHQVRDSKRRFDFSNSIEVLQDLMTAHDFIPDDDTKYVMPVPMTKEGDLIDPECPSCYPLYSVNKNGPGCYIKVF